MWTTAFLKAAPMAPDTVKAQQPDDAAARGRGARIRCPLCKWQPCEADRWQCECGCVWNTFDTHARCPACGKQWLVTQCLACGEFSPHEDWYAKDEDAA